MAKVQIKSERLTPFGGIFSIMEQFDSIIKAEVLAWMSDIKKEQGEYKEAMKLAEDVYKRQGLPFSYSC